MRDLKTRPWAQGVILVRATAGLLVCQTLLWIWSPGARAAESGAATVKAGALELTWSAAGQDRLDHVRTHLMSQPHLNGIYLDSMANHFSRVCYPKENLEYATYPPLFDRRTLQPCSMVAFAAWEWVDALWDMLPPQKRELLPNLYGQITPIPWHRLTVMGKEHRLEPAGPLMQQYRTMGYRKVVTQLPATNWKHTLTSWQRFDPDRVHHLRLRLDKDTYRLELDDQRIGEGLHECSFGWAYVALGVYSGHRGRGDVCWWDNLRAYRAP